MRAIRSVLAPALCHCIHDVASQLVVLEYSVVAF